MPSLEGGGICGEKGSWRGGGKSIFSIKVLVLVVVPVEDMEEVPMEEMVVVSGDNNIFFA
jgi:hypothetical protein